MKTIFLSLLFLLSSCGKSPLLNHKMEKNQLADLFYSESRSIELKKVSHSFVMNWVDGPKLGESKFLMKTWSHQLGTLNGPYQDLPHTLHVFLWMPSMGHGSAPVKLKKIGQGEYEVSNVQFIMGGKWEVKFQIIKDKQVIDEAIVPLTL